MIALAKGEKPDILRVNEVIWRDGLLDLIARGEATADYLRNKYGRDEVKDALKAETAGKCAYCESKPLHVTYGDVEHIVAKSRVPDRTFEWENLTLACDVCNTKKGSRDGLLDPYSVDPEQHFSFYGPMIMHNEGCAAAEYTRIVLDLNRSALLEKRCEAIDRLRNLVDRISLNPDPAERDILLEVTFEYETSQEREYAACLRSFVSKRT